MINNFTANDLVFPLGGKTLFTIKPDGRIERGEGFTTEDEMSLRFWTMIEQIGVRIGPQPRKIEYDIDQKNHRILLPQGAPFDGKPVLIKVASGWCEAWWLQESITQTAEGSEADGFYWVCMDDDFHADLDEAKYWLPLPTESRT